MKNRLREIRKEIGIPISELARRANTSRQTIYSIERQDHKDVSGRVMLSISKALRTDVTDIFFIDDVTHEEQKSKSTA